jgi:hypothetical protein
MANDKDLSPHRTAALRKWLHIANARLLMIERQRRQIMANATALLQRLEGRPTDKRPKRPRLVSRMAKSG